MSDNTLRTIKYIEEQNSEDFNNILKNNNDIDYSSIDKELLFNKNFDMQAKIDYCYNFSREELLASLEEDVKGNYLNYSYLNILVFALARINDKNEKLKYVIIAFIMAPKIRLDSFNELLKKYNYYDEFINYVKSSKDAYLLLKTTIFLNPALLLETFGSYRNAVNYVNESRLGKKESMDFLIGISSLIKKDPDLQTEIENIIISYSNEYNERLNSELEHLDEELLLLNKVNYEDYIRTVVTVLRNNIPKESEDRSYFYK